MNAKVANLIAIETGILIGIISWLVYSHFPSADPGTATTTGERTLGSATVPVAAAPASDTAPQNISAAEHSADREQARMMAERAASLQSYYLALARESGTKPVIDNGSVVADTPTYAVTDQPATVPEYAAPSSTYVYYAEPIPTVVFPRHAGNRCRQPRHRETRSPNLPLRAGPSILTLRNQPIDRVVPGQNFVPASGFRPRGGLVSQAGRAGSKPVEDGKRSVK